MNWDRRWVWAAVAMGLGMLALSLVLRPLWRDEYWALYFSNPALPLGELIMDKMPLHEHPPSYYSLLHFWRLIIDTDLWARLLNVVLYALAGWSIWRLGRDNKLETGAFLLLAVTSHAFIFYGAEARMYALMFAGCAVTCFLARRALRENAYSMAALFALVGFITGFSHLFGTLWISVLGGWMTLAFAKRGTWPSAFAWAAATALAIAPVLGWIAMVRPDDIYNASLEGERFWAELWEGTNQFLRGLLVKTFGSNLIAFAAALLCAGPLIRRKDPFDAVLSLSVASCVVIPFAIHIFYEPMIKERAFIIMMPAVILLAARAMDSVREDQKLARRLIAWVPIAAFLSPILFVGEFFKDRERLGEVRQLISESGACRDAPVAVYYRPAIQGADYSEFVVARAFRGAANGGDLKLLNLETLNAPPAAKAGCRVRVIAPLLPRGQRDVEQEDVRTRVRAAGFDLDQLEERVLGSGRTLVYLDRGGS